MPTKLSTAVDNYVEDKVKAGFSAARAVNNMVYNFRPAGPDTPRPARSYHERAGWGVHPEDRDFLDRREE